MNVGNLEDYGLESETVLYLERVLALNEFEGFVVRVLAAGELDNGVRVFFEKLDEEGEGFFSILALMRAYRTCMDPEMKQKPSERFQELYRSFLKGRTLADWILEPGKDGSFSLRETLKLSVRIRDLVLGEQWDLPELEEDGRWFWPGESDRKNRISFFGEELYQKWSRHALENKGSIVLLEGAGRNRKENSGDTVWKGYRTSCFSCRCQTDCLVAARKRRTTIKKSDERVPDQAVDSLPGSCESRRLGRGTFVFAGENPAAGKILSVGNNPADRRANPFVVRVKWHRQNVPGFFFHAGFIGICQVMAGDRRGVSR